MVSPRANGAMRAASRQRWRTPLALLHADCYVVK
jgi:hypothetical protein